MEADQAERDALVVRRLEAIDDIETKIEDLYSVGRPRTLAAYLLLLLVPVAALLAVVFVPGLLSLWPFLLVACAYAFLGMRWIGTKNEELAQLKEDRARLTEGPST
jgi:hypothetical protein